MITASDVYRMNGYREIQYTMTPLLPGDCPKHAEKRAISLSPVLKYE